MDEFIGTEEKEKLEYFTNIHTHGLHISAYEDDPTVEIPAGTSFYYEFNVFSNKFNFTYWLRKSELKFAFSSDLSIFNTYVFLFLLFMNN